MLRLSRKDSATIEPLPLKPWVEKFIVEFNECNDIQSNKFKLIFKPENIVVSTDINHLHQVLWNLSINAVKYVENKNNDLSITLSAYTNSTTKISYLDVIDTGPGIKSTEQEKLFEPFYTTSNSGTGLGLYISRELCLSYGGDLTYSTTANGGSCFRIRFSQKQS